MAKMETEVKTVLGGKYSKNSGSKQIFLFVDHIVFEDGIGVVAIIP